MYSNMHQTPPSESEASHQGYNHMAAQPENPEIYAPSEPRPKKPTVASFLIRLLVIILSIVSFALVIGRGMRHDGGAAFGVFNVLCFVWNFALIFFSCLAPFTALLPPVTFIIGNRKFALFGHDEDGRKARLTLRIIWDAILVICLTVTTGVGPASMWGMEAAAGIGFVNIGLQWCHLAFSLDEPVQGLFKGFQEGRIRLTPDTNAISVAA